MRSFTGRTGRVAALAASYINDPTESAWIREAVGGPRRLMNRTPLKRLLGPPVAKATSPPNTPRS